MRRYISEEMSGWEMEGKGRGSMEEGRGEEDAAQRIKEKNVLTGRPSRSVAVIRGGDNEGDESGRGSDWKSGDLMMLIG